MTQQPFQGQLLRHRQSQKPTPCHTKATPGEHGEHHGQMGNGLSVRAIRTAVHAGRASTEVEQGQSHICSGKNGVHPLMCVSCRPVAETQRGGLQPPQADASTQTDLPRIEREAQTLSSGELQS